MKSLKINLALILILFCFKVNCQSSENNVNKKFSFGINFSPDYSYRRLHLNNPDYDFISNQLNDWEIPAFGYTTGFSIRYLFFKRFEIESGLQFSDKTYNFEINKDDFEIPDNVIYQPDDPAIPEKSITKNHFYYLGVPIKMNYYFYQKRIRMYVSAGVSTDFLFDDKSKSFMKFSDGTEVNTDFENDYDYNKTSLTGLAGFGAETNLSQRFGIRIEPVFRYSITPLLDELMKINLYSAGLNVIFFYK